MDGTSNMFDGSECSTVSEAICRRSTDLLTVEKQQVGLAEQRSCERQAHAPTTGERLGCMLLPLWVETETGEDASRAWLRLVRVHLGQLRVDIAKRDVEPFTLLV